MSTLTLVFLSGFCALVYQVLWMKQLGLLFGNTSHAAGVTLAAFFAGLATGSWFWGRRSSSSGNPIRIYAGLELGIAVTALLYFVVMHGYHLIYPSLYQSVHSGFWLLIIKFLLALILIFPPAFCMGGTIPVIGQHAIRTPLRFGSTSALLYGVNTLGATLGAFLAGFFMPLWFGYRLTCWLAIAITLLVAVLAYLMSRKPAARIPSESEFAAEPAEDAKAGAVTQTRGQRRALTVVCFLSGFTILALEVLWTRMFSLVLENSVYTFAAILVVVLCCLAGGSLVSSFLARRQWPTGRVLSVLLVLGGVSIALTPTIFMTVTDDFRFQSVRAEWAEFVGMIFSKCALTIGPPALILGTVFPYLMKIEERHTTSPGLSLGRLATINTVGAILGSLLVAFVLIGQFGLWRSMQVLGAIYFVVALLIANHRSAVGLVSKGVAALGLILLFVGLNPTRLPATGVLSDDKHDKILKVWEGSDCTVSVVEGSEGLSIMINSDYGLGSTSGFVRQASQAEIPLMLMPEAKSVFFLGMGTGMSAGAALSDRFPQVERVVTCELSPHVIEASKEFMTDVDGVDLTQGLFTDPRSTVIAEDGRHYLMATEEQFDMINADLFVPYRSGAGSLYTIEHFQNVKSRLKEDGVFVQWLPLYQLTEFQVHVIGRTMGEVFDQVTLWRCDFAPFNEVVAFVGHKGGSPLPASDLDASQTKLQFLQSRGQMSIHDVLNPQTAAVYYCGNLTKAKHLFEGYPLNTDDKPIIEYQGPREYRNVGDDETPWFVGPRILNFIKEVQEACPPDKDPMLIQRTPANRRLPLAGTAYHETRLWEGFGNSEGVEKNWQRFVKAWLNRE